MRIRLRKKSKKIKTISFLLDIDVMGSGKRVSIFIEDSTVHFICYSFDKLDMSIWIILPFEDVQQILMLGEQGRVAVVIMGQDGRSTTKRLLANCTGV